MRKRTVFVRRYLSFALAFFLMVGAMTPVLVFASDAVDQSLGGGYTPSRGGWP